MSRTRRNILLATGGAAAILAAGAGGFLATRTPGRALAPWHHAGSGETEPRRRALSYAILAPNPHNRQPWLVGLAGGDEAVLSCQLDRRLPETDPFDRQIAIGLGCFLEIARMAAAEDGIRLEIEPFPEGEPGEAARLDERPVARLRFVPDEAVARDPLFAQVPARRSNKEPFETGRAVAPAALQALTAAAGTGAAAKAEPGHVERLRALTWAAMETEMRTPAAYMESVRLMRIGKAEIEASPDGIDLGGPVLETLRLLGQLSRDKLADMSSTTYEIGLDGLRPPIETAMAHFWIATPGNTRRHQLAAGRAYVRANLAATALGLGMHPLSQALQEYAEMEGHFEAVHRLLGAPEGGRVQMLARLGYGPAVRPSPRWPLETRIKDA